jgi:hypothetical protein
MSKMLWLLLTQGCAQEEKCWKWNKEQKKNALDIKLATKKSGSGKKKQ